ncbi:hypothetical protein LCGC14_2443600, partial [marine sediment metagenome]
TMNPLEMHEHYTKCKLDPCTICFKYQDIRQEAQEMKETMEEHQ